MVHVNEATRYEIVLEAPDGRKWLVAYSARKTLSALRGCLCKRAEAALRIMQKTAPQMRRLHGARFRWGFAYDIDGWSLYYSGRTQRDAQTDQLPYIDA